MSITKDFEKCYDTDNGYPAEWVGALLAHTRALEAMLKKHEWGNADEHDNQPCPECGGEKPIKSIIRRHGHAPDCALAKLLEGVEE